MVLIISPQSGVELKFRYGRTNRQGDSRRLSSGRRSTFESGNLFDLLGQLNMPTIELPD